MKKIIIIVIILILLLGGGVGVMSMLGIGPFANLDIFKKDEKKDEKKAEEGMEEATPAAPKSVYYDAGSYIIPVVENHAIVRQVGIDLSIEVDPKQSVRVGSELPRLQDAFVTALFDTIPRYSDTKSSANKQAIHDRLMAVSTKMFGAGVIRDVYIKSIYDR